MTMTETESVTSFVTEMNWQTLNALATVSASAGTDKARPILLAVHLFAGNGEMTAEATDSYTLARISVESDVTGLDALIPAKWLVSTLKALKPLARNVAGALVTLSIEGGTVTLSNGDITMSSLLVEGNFPKTEQLIPVEANYMAELGAFDGAKLARMAAILPEISTRFNEYACTTWQCVSMSVLKPSLWTRTYRTTEGASLTGMFLVVPVRVN